MDSIGNAVTAVQFQKFFRSIVAYNWKGKLSVQYRKNQIMSMVVKRTITVQKTINMLEANVARATERGITIAPNWDETVI